MFGIIGRVILRPIVAMISATLAILCCLRCAGCRMRDCACMKRFLRWTGHDEFDDFELMVQVQEARYQPNIKKTKVRLTAGPARVETDPDSKGSFHQPLHLTIEQGTYELKVELMDHHNRVLADTSMNIVEKIVRPPVLEPDMVLRMKPRKKSVTQASLTLTMVIATDADEETGGFPGGQESDLDYLFRRQLEKARKEGSGASELEILKKASTGPLELFEGLGKTTHCFVAVLGPPKSRRWMIAFWHAERDYEANRPPFLEVNLLKVQSVQSDPSRHHVFVINYFDEARVGQTLTLRRIDRARDVWVEILHAVVQKAHDQHDEKKQRKRCQTEHSGSHGSRTRHDTDSFRSKNSKRL